MGHICHNQQQNNRQEQQTRLSASACHCCSSLTKQNAWLRARETMQMQLLSTQEDMLVHLGTILLQTTDTQHDSSALTTAVMLDLKAQVGLALVLLALLCPPA